MSDDEATHDGPQTLEEWRAHAQALEAQIAVLKPAVVRPNDEWADVFLAQGTADRLAAAGASAFDLSIVLGAMARLGQTARWDVVRAFQSKHSTNL